jgi:hypothetical protein
MAALATLSVGLSAVGYGGAQLMEDRVDSGRRCSASCVPQPERTPSPKPSTAKRLGPTYNRAVSRMVRVNHLLEERQAALSHAEKAGAPASVIADLHVEVATIERRYADAIAAMTRAIPETRDDAQ